MTGVRKGHLPDWIGRMEPGEEFAGAVFPEAILGGKYFAC